jgi:DNA invertase Pin-like site-specific DNA recombinase
VKTENFTKINPFSLAHTHFSCLFQAGIYADEGISGTDTKKRDEFNRMMDNCAVGEIDLIRVC